MLIDITRLVIRTLQGRLPTGVDRVSLEYVRHFRGGSSGLVRFGGHWVVLGRGNSQRMFDALLAPDARFIRVVSWSVGSSYMLSWSGGSGRGVLLNTGHSGLDHPGYARQVRRRKLRPLFFLHDLIPVTHPEYCHPGETERHRRRLATMLSVGYGLVINSFATRAALEDYAGRYGWRVPPCVVAPLATSRLPPPEATSPFAAPYFVVLGTIEPRKNHLLLLHLWRQLVDGLGEAAPRLVVVGQRGWECEQVEDLLDRCSALEGFVIEKAQCADAELATLLYHAQALLFPSFVEGFGIPLIEAFSLGVPVIASAMPAFREIAGDIPEYLDPLDGAGWKRLILEYSHPDSPARQAQCRRIKEFQAPTWEAHWSAVEDLLERVDTGL